MHLGGVVAVILVALAGCGTEPPFELHLTVQNTLDSSPLDTVAVSSSDGPLPGNPVVVTFASFDRALGTPFSITSTRGAQTATMSITIGTECESLASRMDRDIGSLKRENRVIQLDAGLMPRTDTVDCAGTDGAVEDYP